MGLDYALVHLYYTIPPAFLLTVVFAPLSNAIDVYKVATLICIAVTATIPWDSFLIRNQVWGYPSNAVLGYTLWEIPVEELFFFVIQTYNTSLLYILFSKSTLHLTFLRGKHGDSHLRSAKRTGAAVIVAVVAIAECIARVHRQAFYTKLIVVWAGPFLLVLWLLSYQLLVNLPWWNTLLPIAVPTVYLWVVDTIALRRGTWVINTGTKLGWQLWDGLEFEEAAFFLVTNALIVFGHVAFDNALAVLDLDSDTRASLCHQPDTLPSPILLVKALLIPVTEYNESYINGIQGAVERLHRKSRSFYIASGAFPRDARRKLVLLFASTPAVLSQADNNRYSYCRVADDLIDDRPSWTKGDQILEKLHKYLDLQYDSKIEKHAVNDYITQTFPSQTQFTFRNLPIARVPSPPFYEMLEGFTIDLQFSSNPKIFPVADEDTLENYATCVASTVAEMCIELILSYCADLNEDKALRERILQAGRTMGLALQYVNIARDIRIDARMGRVYLPTSWLATHGLKPRDVLANPDHPEIEKLRRRMIERAFTYYTASRAAIELLPYSYRRPLRVMIESYMEIGRTMLQSRYRVRDGKATVGLSRRIWIAWKALVV